MNQILYVCYYYYVHYSVQTLEYIVLGMHLKHIQ